MQNKNGQVNMTDDEIFDRVISGTASSFADDFDKIALSEKLERVLSEVQSLRDQLFTISMASVSNGETKVYESYNNIMVDELSEIKDAIASLIAIGKEGLTLNTKPLTDKLDEMKETSSSSEIEALKKTVAEQKETQAAMFELLNKMMEKLDEQEKSNAKLANEIATTISKEPVAIEESTESRKEVMTEIENIKQAISAMQGNDNNSDDDLETSIAKLKAELSQMAGIIDGKK